MAHPRISVVTPTYKRPEKARELIENLAQQTVPIFELVLVDGAPAGEDDTHQAVEPLLEAMPYRIQYIRRGGGTAIQRNIGIDAAEGDFVSFVDDDMLLDPDFYEQMLGVFASDEKRAVGGIIGYITNQHFDMFSRARWRWYRRLRLLTTYEPGRYDFETGLPVNRYAQPPHDGVREVDFMSTNSAIWRREVFDQGLRFDEFFRDYGVLEDAHLSLHAAKKWKLLECGRAHCRHMHASGGRIDSRKWGYKSAVNYRYVFMDIRPDRSWWNDFRFFRFQVFELVRFTAAAVRANNSTEWLRTLGKIEGINAALWMKQPTRT